MKSAIEIINLVASQTDNVILFHSASGKDSIALLDMLNRHFKRIVCVYMFVVKDLSHINRYIVFATKKYPNIEFMQIPHFTLFNYIKLGYMGIEKNKKQREYSLSQLNEIVREKTGIEWTCLGFKQSDGLNRRLMLKTYEHEAINKKNKKFYPLSQYKNSDVLEYINKNKLIKPEIYGKSRSNGTAINDIDYLLWLRKNYPEDLKKTINIFPHSERLLFEHDYSLKNENDNTSRCNSN